MDLPINADSFIQTVEHKKGLDKLEELLNKASTEFANDLPGSPVQDAKE